MPFKNIKIGLNMFLKDIFIGVILLRFSYPKLTIVYFLTSNNSTSKINGIKGLIAPPSRGKAP
jgi:hypothetical protein